MNEETINWGALPEPTMRRLPWYLAYVQTLAHQGVKRVSTTEIAAEVDVDAAKISKDLSQLNISGKPRVGYDVQELEHALTSCLGFGKQHRAVIIGVGSLGGALIRDVGLMNYGINIVAGFDINPELTGSKIGNVAIYPLEALGQKRRQLKAAVAILAVPIENAQDVARMCEQAGFRALWNFTPCRVKTHGDMVVQNVSIYSSLAIMYNKMAQVSAK